MICHLLKTFDSDARTTVIAPLPPRKKNTFKIYKEKGHKNETKQMCITQSGDVAARKRQRLQREAQEKDRNRRPASEFFVEALDKHYAKHLKQQARSQDQNKTNSKPQQVALV